MESKGYYRLINKEKIKKISNKNDRDLDIFLECKKIIDSNEIHVIALYFPKNLEVNTINLIDYALKKKKIVCLPKIKEGNNMDFIKIDFLFNLENSKLFNIKEPIYNEEKIINPEKIDVMFIPLIGFDKYNHRLGYGKGYYDTYLKNNHNILTIGLGYKETEIREEIFNKFDVPLQKILFK